LFLICPKNTRTQFIIPVKSSFWFDANTNSVYTTATLELAQLKIPAAKHASVKVFFDEVMLENAQRIVIKKNN
jgi:hypothetical protein